MQPLQQSANPGTGISPRVLTSIPLLLPIVMWVWLCADWPSRLGFFSDDWILLLHTYVGTAQAFRDILSVVASRPASVPYIWLAQVVIDGSPVRSQLLNAAMLLLTAVSLGYLSATLVRISGAPRRAAIVAAGLAAAAFICFPSNAGTFSWGVGVVAVVPATPFFCCGMALWVCSEDSTGRLVLGSILLLLSHLSYEAFYFQEVTVILSVLVLSRKASHIQALRLIGLAVVLNVACIVFNRWTPGGIHKPFNPDWWAIFSEGYSRIIDVFGHAVRECRRWLGWTLIGTLLLGSACLSLFAGLPRALTFLLVLVCGAAAAGILYSFAGYGFAAEGPNARVAIVVAFYFSIGVGVLSAAALRASDGCRLLATAFLVSTIALLFGMGLSSKHRLDEWAEAWTYEVARLSRLPSDVRPEDHRNGAFLAIDDRAWSFVEPATAPWEIMGAVAWTVYNRTGDRRMMSDAWTSHNWYWFAAPRDWLNRWDGQRFEQRPCASQAAVYGRSASELWVWKTATTELRKVEAPWELGCK